MSRELKVPGVEICNKRGDGTKFFLSFDFGSAI